METPTAGDRKATSSTFRILDPTPSTATLTLAAMPGEYRPIGQAARKSAPEAPHVTKPAQHQVASHNKLIPHRADTTRL